ncbi:hypothetical protein GCM10011607_04600 [Shewanella inventionis]|uniref:Uncharacterized protein n=1 Tax=Shewanella inventionis TaxID=1738770 RepID=A0ABQ1IQH0_9GAMM|nr:hypothetical protein [Shewanella inventionis]MCL1159051.1 hypothetical protein [Shewanella inventionis]GGB47432.1 hypothetical protein GCM10011607_04600 [Shewanella inventionis]
MQFSWLVVLLLTSAASCIGFGVAAYRQGLGVKRWGFLALLLGPLTYPLFSTHKRLADVKLLRQGGYKIQC